MALIETDSTDVLLTSDGELDLSSGTVALVSGRAAVLQGVRSALQLATGEWFLNQGAGVPWFTEILGLPFDEQRAARAIQIVLLAVPGIVEVIEVNVTFDSTTRIMSVSYRARAEFGADLEDAVEIS